MWGVFVNFASKMKLVSIVIGSMLLLSGSAQAQTDNPAHVPLEECEVDMEHPTMVPMVKVGRVMLNGDSVQYMEMNNVYVYPPIELKSENEKRRYDKLVRDVKKTLPIAKEANRMLIETFEYLQTLPNKKAKDAHMKRVEKDIFNTYKPRMKKLTFSQGKMLIKLINRECNSSSYEIVKSFLGSVRAGFYQAFAWTCGASLKKKYEPESSDKETERVVLLVEAGQL